MFPRNLTLFRFPLGTVPAFEIQTIDGSARDEFREPTAILAGARECELKPVGPLELSSCGFVSPYGRESDFLLAGTSNATWLTIGREDRILPASVVNEVVARKLADIEANEGRKPGGRARKRIKDEVIADLLPRAFVRPSSIDAIVDHAHGIVAVDTSSRRAGENIVSEIRRALGSFPALHLNAEVAPRSVLTGWLAGEPLPDGLALGDECELRDPVDRGAKVRCTDMELQGEEVAKHLESGKQCTRLALTLDDHVSFVLGEDLVLRKFRLLDGAIDTLESADREDMQAELDARFVLMAGELHRLFAVLEKALRISKAEH